MKIKRFSGSSTRDVLQQIRMSLGPDAVILSNRDVNGEVEIVAAIDFDEQQCTEAHATPTWPGPLQVGDLSPTPEPQVSSLQRTVAIPETSVPVVSSVAPTSPLRSELQALRQLVEKRWGHSLSGKPAKDSLTDMGFSVDWAAHLVQQCPEADWEKTLKSTLEDQIGLSSVSLEKGGIFVLLGPTGSGKTTSIAKLAAAQVLRHGPHSVALLTTDTYRIAGVEQLEIYARILGVPLEVIRSPEDLLQALNKHDQRPWIFIDTIGMSPRDPRLGEQLQWLAALGTEAHRFLMIPAGLSGKSLPTVLAPYAGIPLAGAILSKVDETPAFGGVLEWLAQQHLPVAYYSDGQKVPEDLHEAQWESLMRLLQTSSESTAPGSKAQNHSHHGA